MNEHTLDELEKRIESIENDVFSRNSGASKVKKLLLCSFQFILFLENKQAKEELLALVRM